MVGMDPGPWRGFQRSRNALGARAYPRCIKEYEPLLPWIPLHATDTIAILQRIAELFSG